MHLLGGVRGGVVDDDPLARARLGDAERGRAGKGREPGGEPVGRNRDVEEAGPGQFDLLDEVRLRLHQLREHGLGNLARRQAQHPGARQRVVALEVAEPRIRGRHGTDLREVISRKRGLETAPQPFFNRHTSSCPSNAQNFSGHAGCVPLPKAVKGCHRSSWRASGASSPSQVCPRRSGGRHRGCR